jgi:hypothetical protein
VHRLCRADTKQDAQYLPMSDPLCQRCHLVRQLRPFEEKSSALMTSIADR